MTIQEIIEEFKELPGYDVNAMLRDTLEHFLNSKLEEYGKQEWKRGYNEGYTAGNMEAL